MAMKYKSSDSRKVPAQPPQWNQFLICSVCENEFNRTDRCPISLGCGHTVCRGCLGDLKHPQCQFDQNSITCDISDLPVNSALLLLVPEEESHKGSVEMRGVSQKGKENFHPGNIAQCVKLYDKSKKHIEELALLLRPNKGNELSRPMQRKLVALINCQLVEEEGRKRALRAGRALGERSATELILLHQNPTTLSASLWAAVRARGCQFLGPAMQE
uniref:Roquin-1-like n=2 Tax=Ciona intestinalis TaxID=7719 RepID=F6XHL9_CIOIN